MPNGCMASGGSALNWFVDKLAKGERENAQSCGITLHQYLDKIATETLPGSEGVQIIPYFLGEKTPIHDPYARGIIRGISLNHDLRHMWRALLEGFGYALLEGAAIGLPIVTTNTVGCREAVVNNKTGWGVPAHRIEPIGHCHGPRIRSTQ